MPVQPQYFICRTNKELKLMVLWNRFPSDGMTFHIFSNSFLIFLMGCFHSENREIKTPFESGIKSIKSHNKTTHFHTSLFAQLALVKACICIWYSPQTIFLVFIACLCTHSLRIHLFLWSYIFAINKDLQPLTWHWMLGWFAFWNEYGQMIAAVNESKEYTHS